MNRLQNNQLAAYGYANISPSEDVLAPSSKEIAKAVQVEAECWSDERRSINERTIYSKRCLGQQPKYKNIDRSSLKDFNVAQLIRNTGPKHGLKLLTVDILQVS